MESLRQVGTGILLAVVSVMVVLGGFTLATAEGRMTVGSTEVAQSLPTETYNPTPLSVVTDTSLPPTAVPSTTPLPSPTGMVQPTLTVIPSTTSQPTSSVCPPPAGWIAIIVQPYDTLSSLAYAYDMSMDAIRQANCLNTDQLQAGTLLYVIPLPTATLYQATYAPCGSPYGWVDYYVVAGDTLYNISWRYGITVTELQKANCLGTSVYIRVGQKLKVPYVATLEPYYTPTLVPTEYIPPTEEPTVIIPVETETPIPTEELPTPVIEPTATDVPPTPETPVFYQVIATNTPFAVIK